MLSIYPTNFSSINGESYVDENGELTKIGEMWVHEIGKLHMSQISTAMDNLKFKTNAQFAPSAVEFASFCIDFGASECANEILEHIQDDNHWWSSEAAFNVYISLGYSPARNQTDPQIIKDIERVYRHLEFDNLKPIPTKSIGVPVKEPNKIERNKWKFQGLMFFCINKLRPDLFLSAPTKDISDMTTNQIMEKFNETKRPLTDLVDFITEMRGMEKDEKTLALFTPHKSNELMIKWYREKQPPMTDFLRNEGFAI